MNHIRHHHDTYGPVPLCGQAMWDELVDDEDPANECWECASIAGVEQPSERDQ